MVSNLDRPAEEVLHRLDDIARIRLAVLIVHDDNRQASFRRDLSHRPRLLLVLQPPDIIEHVAAGLRGLARRLGLECVDRDRHRALLEHGFEERHEALDLLLGRHRLEAGAAGLRADIDDVRTIAHHLLHMAQCLVMRVPLAAVRERIRRHVEHAHDERALAQFQFLAIMKGVFPQCCHPVYLLVPSKPAGRAPRPCGMPRGILT